MPELYDYYDSRAVKGCATRRARIVLDPDPVWDGDEPAETAVAGCTCLAFVIEELCPCCDSVVDTVDSLWSCWTNDADTEADAWAHFAEAMGVETVSA